MQLLSLFALLLVLTAVGAFLRARHAELQRSVKRLFTTPAGPFNLAIARIFYFLAVAVTLPSRDTVELYVQLPHALITPPHGLAGVLASLPISSTWVGVSHMALLIACLCGIVGVLPRIAAGVVVLAGFYYLGIPQLFGKVTHYHHLLWIGLIFVFSPSADAFSLQALWRAFRRGSRQEVEPIPSGLAYALPLRFIWLLMGVLYLFAGLAKYRFDGLLWFAPQTLRHWLHLLWYQTGYRPPLVARPDHVAPLLFVGATFTLLFETTFLFWLVLDRARPFLAAAGLVFHNSTKLLMNIPFYSLQLLYPSLIDWDRLSERLLAKRPLFLVYDGNCGICKKIVVAFRSLMPIGSVKFVNGLDRIELEASALGWLDRSATVRDLHVVCDGRVYVGFEAYRRLARRVPVLWPLLPLLWLPPIPKTGRLIYSRFATRRARGRGHDAVPSPITRPTRTWPVVAITGMLLAVVTFNGVRGLASVSASQAAVNGWPIASYPTFAGVSDDTKEVLSLYGRRPGSVFQPIALRRELPFLTSDRLDE